MMAMMTAVKTHGIMKKTLRIVLIVEFIALEFNIKANAIPIRR